MYWIPLLGVATGMRTMTAMAVVCWAAHLGYLPVEGTWAFWTANLGSVIVFTVLALGEYVGDTLPGTPNRTAFPLLLARLAFGTLVGAIIATVYGQPKAGGIVLAAMGVLVGAYGGVRLRVLGVRRVGRDLPVALAESALALYFALFALYTIYLQTVGLANPPVLLVPR